MVYYASEAVKAPDSGLPRVTTLPLLESVDEFPPAEPSTITLSILEDVWYPKLPPIVSVLFAAL